MRLAVLDNTGPGGAQRMTWEVVRRLSATDEIIFGSWSNDPPLLLPSVSTVWTPASFIRLPSPLHPFGDLARSAFASRRCAEAVNSASVDAVLVFPCRWSQAPEALRRLDPPVVYFAQEGRRRNIEVGYQPFRERAGIQRPVWSVGRRAYDLVAGHRDRKSIESASILATNSFHSARQLQRAYGLLPTVIHLGVDTDVFSHDPAGEKDQSALLVGGLEPAKGAELAIRALAELGATISLVLVYNRGDNAFANHLRSLASSLDVSLRLCPNLSEEDLVAAYRRADVALALSPNEPFGLTVLEANATGTPVVAVRSGGFLETVAEGLSGFLVDATPAAVAAGIREVLNRTVLPPAELATRTAELWSWDSTVAQLRDLIRGLIETDR